MDRVKRDVSLKPYNTFGLDVKANLLLEPETTEDLKACLVLARSENSRSMILGSGSNLLFVSDFNGTLIRPCNSTRSIIDEDDRQVRVLAGAGLEMDALIRWCVDRNLGGLENLSLIPGTVGAAPVQNIGAYGAEVAETIEAVRVLDLLTGEEQWMDNRDCQFGYRMSRFKSRDFTNKLVWEVIFSLRKNPVPNLSYQPLQEVFKDKENSSVSEVREAVIKIRRSKLPDPSEIGNAGSFFKNPVVPANLASGIRLEYPLMPAFPQEDGQVKIPAGWLIEQCGWKGYREGAIGVYPRQALVLVNYGGATGIELLNLAERIRESVLLRFRISLEREVRVIEA
ncbi:MAG: UDP-N-acetylmuramate dehydrogenase [Bacteroidales bacterium]